MLFCTGTAINPFNDIIEGGMVKSTVCWRCEKSLTPREEHHRQNFDNYELINEKKKIAHHIVINKPICKKCQKELDAIPYDDGPAVGHFST